MIPRPRLPITMNKYEEVYLRAYAPVQQASTSLGRNIELYNQIGAHSNLKGRTPEQVHFNTLPEIMAA